MNLYSTWMVLFWVDKSSTSFAGVLYLMLHQDHKTDLQWSVPYVRLAKVKRGFIC